MSWAIRLQPEKHSDVCQVLRRTSDWDNLIQLQWRIYCKLSGLQNLYSIYYIPFFLTCSILQPPQVDVFFILFISITSFHFFTFLYKIFNSSFHLLIISVSLLLVDIYFQLLVRLANIYLIDLDIILTHLSSKILTLLYPSSLVFF